MTLSVKEIFTMLSKHRHVKIFEELTTPHPVTPLLNGQNVSIKLEEECAG